MTRKKISDAALKRLEEKGVNITVIKATERPHPLNKLPEVTNNAAPFVHKQNVENVVRLRKWNLEIEERDWQGFIKSLTITEI